MDGDGRDRRVNWWFPWWLQLLVLLPIFWRRKRLLILGVDYWLLGRWSSSLLMASFSLAVTAQGSHLCGQYIARAKLPARQRSLLRPSYSWPSVPAWLRCSRVRS